MRPSNVMRIVIAWLLLLDVLTGCKSKCGKAGTCGEDVLVRFETLTKNMCDCRDRSCVDKVDGEMTRWLAKLAERPPEVDAEGKPDPEVAKKQAELLERYRACMTEVTTAR